MQREVFEHLSRTQIDTIKFESVDPFNDTQELTAKHRVLSAEMAKISSDDEKQIKLRKKMAALFHDRLDGDYSKLESRTYVKESIFRKIHAGSRKITREQLALFVVGLSLDIDTAEELFELQSRPLSEANRFDYITACAIRDGDSKEQYYDDLMAYGYTKMFRE